MCRAPFECVEVKAHNQDPHSHTVTGRHHFSREQRPEVLFQIGMRHVRCCAPNARAAREVNVGIPARTL